MLCPLLLNSTIYIEVISTLTRANLGKKKFYLIVWRMRLIYYATYYYLQQRERVTSPILSIFKKNFTDVFLPKIKVPLQTGFKSNYTWRDSAKHV